MKIVRTVFLIPLVLLVVLSLGKTLFAVDESRDNPASQFPVVVPQFEKAEITQKTKKLHVPFIANEGQADEQVKYYANTFAGSVFVTKDGEIVYSLPGKDSGQEARDKMREARSKNQDAGVCKSEACGEQSRTIRNPNVPVQAASQNQQEMHYGPRVMENGIRTTPEILDIFFISYHDPISGNQNPKHVVSEAEPSDQVGWIKALSFAPNPSPAESQYLVDSHSLNPPYKTCLQSGLENHILGMGRVDKGVGFYAVSTCNDHTNGGFALLNPPYNTGIPQSDANDVALKEDDSPRPLRERDRVRGLSLKETFIGAKTSQIKGEGSSAAKVSYFKGNDPSQWKTNLATAELVNLGEVYEGIDLRLKAYGNNVEKLFTVKPGANPGQIKIGLDAIQPPESPFVNGEYRRPGGDVSTEKGVRGLSVNEHGELEVETELGAVKFTKPVAYQEIDGKRVEVECGYVISDCGMQNAECKTNLKSEFQNPKSEYGFKVTSYDTTKDLIIDPLLASTYLGGSSGENLNAMAIDKEGNVYVTGWTWSGDFPISSNAYDTSNNDNRQWDIFVSKLSGDLTQLIASTYLGTDQFDIPTSIAIDKNENIFVAGYTYSNNFPTTSGAFDTTWNGNNWTYYNGFVSKLNSNLTQLLASTYLGGTGFVGDQVNSIAIDADGNVYVAGSTDSPNFPTTSGSYDTSMDGRDAFVSKLSGDLSSLLASTYLGGTTYYDGDQALSISIDKDENIYVAGSTGSLNFPTTNDAYDTSFNGERDVFVSKFNSNLTELLASTHLGGTYSEYGQSIAIDRSGNIFVGGRTLSSDFPITTDAYDTSYNGSGGGNQYQIGDIFISKVSGDLKNLLASTYLGGSLDDSCGGVVIDQIGNIYVAGSTWSTDFPITVDAYQFGNEGTSDTFVAKLSRT